MRSSQASVFSSMQWRLLVLSHSRKDNRVIYGKNLEYYRQIWESESCHLFCAQWNGKKSASSGNTQVLGVMQLTDSTYVVLGEVSECH